MAGTALRDSPLGTAGWIDEKFGTWSDYDGKLESVISKDRLLTDIMLYVINENGIDGSFWIYRGFLEELKGVSTPGYISVPTAITKSLKTCRYRALRWRLRSECTMYIVLEICQGRALCSNGTTGIIC